MPYLEVRKLEKNYGDFALSASFGVDEGEFLSIIGPSGSGKSTLLSLIAGLEPPDGGTITLGGRDITKERIQDRGIGMVFQEYTLFPSMNVEKNVQFGMKRKDGKKESVQLARALAAEPGILLLDEPLSALDAPLRKSIRGSIRAVHDALGITMLYVTHDREEAFAISDSIMIMDSGKTVAMGTAEELYRHPKDLFSAFFTGEGTAIPAHLFYENTSGCLFFRPEDAIISEEPLNPAAYSMHIIMNDAEIVSAEFMGSGYMLGLDYQGYPVLCQSATKPRRKRVSLMILRESIMNL